MSTNLIESKTINKENQSAKQKITDVYIGMFFDGTNNNMVQKARFEGTGKNIVTKSIQWGYYKVKKGLWLIADKTPFHDEENYNVSLEDGYKPTEEEPSKGFSNIAVMHDNCLLYEKWKEKQNENCICKAYYIEGSGAEDTSEFISQNPNGLGFGLGNTGVTALVSKAVYYVSNFVKSLALEKESVTIHFYNFGFSRGATCARLFSHLINRGKDSRIARENEFSKYYAKTMYENDRLGFLDEYKKQVEFLGIYDTVVSIGYLMQIDGVVHPDLRNFMHGRSDDFQDNWHYKNVYEYGVSLNDSVAEKIKQVCHICALDEFRENFALTDVGRNVPSNAVEVFVPGCHSDVGGGYTKDEEEQEIVLNKRRRPNYPIKAGADNIEGFAQKTDKLENVGTKVSESILHLDLYRPINEGTLASLGWIDSNWNKKERITYKDENGKEKPYTLRVQDTPKKIKFKRNVQGVYSNITLKMMIDFLMKKYQEVNVPTFIDKQSTTNSDNNFFNIKNPYYSIPNEINSLGNEMCSKITTIKNGERCMLYPISENYKALRLKYLHFTCTSDENFHLNNPLNFRGVHTIEGSFGNLGNTPNFDLKGNLCRIIYHSPSEQDLKSIKDLKVENELDYMHKYSESIKKIEVNKL